MCFKKLPMQGKERLIPVAFKNGSKTKKCSRTAMALKWLPWYPEYYRPLTIAPWVKATFIFFSWVRVTPQWCYSIVRLAEKLKVKLLNSSSGSTELNSISPPPVLVPPLHTFSPPKNWLKIGIIKYIICKFYKMLSVKLQKVNSCGASNYSLNQTPYRD